MKSIKTKVIILVSSFTIVSSLIIGAFSIINSRRAVETDSVEILNLLCENKANNINNVLVAIEESVKTLTAYAQRQLPDYNEFKNNKKNINAYINKLLDISINAAENTLGAKTIYIRISPDISDSTTGFFYSKQDDTDKFKAEDPTDIYAYDKDDVEHVGWYYESINDENPTWIGPYFNKNIDTEIISYVVPYYIDHQLVGVVGMDIDFDLLKNVVADTKTYDSGYAFLVDKSAKIIYHNEIDRGTDLVQYNNGEFENMAELIQENDNIQRELVEYTYDGISKEATFRILQNNMRFVLTVPRQEIDAQANNLLLQISTTMLIIVGIAIILTFIFTKRLVKPLLELTEVSKKIANGDLSVVIEHKSKDEVGVLAESFRQTVTHLERYFSFVKSLAYQDSLTGVKNKTAYLEHVISLDEKIKDGTANFNVVVFDINGLKSINDHYGHNSGDTLIINSCKLICNAFKRYPVYRIGGDEFVVILENISPEETEKSLINFHQTIHSFNQKNNSDIDISIASGLSTYSLNIDNHFKEVFERADKSMYENKSQMKKL